MHIQMPEFVELDNSSSFDSYVELNESKEDDEEGSKKVKDSFGSPGRRWKLEKVLDPQ